MRGLAMTLSIPELQLALSEMTAARDEACDAWERCRESYYRGNTDSPGYTYAVRTVAELRAVGKKAT